jgi:hypothetical protein
LRICPANIEAGIGELNRLHRTLACRGNSLRFKKERPQYQHGTAALKAD